MNVTFEGGTDRERGLVSFALGALLHLDMDRYDIDLTVEWVEDPSAEGHNDLAATVTEGTGTGTIQLRNDLDHYKGLGEPFYLETVVHELGHLLTRHLAAELKEEVAALFGTTVASIDDYSSDPPWEDRPFEGIAETFKDAFLPSRYREYTNRTNVHIPIHRYPAFRDIYRRASTGASDGGVEVDYARINQFVYPQYSEDFPAGVVLIWNTIFSGPPDPGTGDPWHPFNPSFDPMFAAYEDSWANPISNPAGQEEWEINFPWGGGGGEGLLNINGGDVPTHTGVSFQWNLVTSSNDNVEDASDFFPKPGWITKWDISVQSFFEKPDDSSVLTGAAMIYHGWYAPDGTLQDYWPDAPEFAGLPMVRYTFWEVAPDESYDPSLGGTFDSFETVEFVERPDWPGDASFPFGVQTPPLPAYIGHFWSYDHTDAGLLTPYGMTARECDLFKTNGHHPDMFIPPADSITFGGSNGLHRYADDVEPDGFASTVWENGDYYGVVGRGTNGLTGDSGDDVTIPVAPGETYSYEFTIPAEWEFTGLHWVFEKRFLGESEDPELRRYTRFDVSTDSSDDFWSAIAESDNWPDAPEHTNSVVDAVAGTFDEVMEVDRGWGEPESGYFWFFTGSWPMTVREEFVVPEGATEMVVNAQMTVQTDDVVLTPEEIQAMLPSFALPCGMDIPVQVVPPSSVASGEAQRGNRLHPRNPS